MDRSEQIKKRWQNLRKRPETDLSLSPDNVARFFEKSRSNLVVDRIKETLTQLADLRVKSRKGFQNDDKGFSTGVLVTCEGLESFLVPAVEGVVPLSVFLDEYHEATKFKRCVENDILELLAFWKVGQFPGDPYLDNTSIVKCLKAEFVEDERFSSPGSLESAAHACKVITHLITLIYNRSEEEQFNKGLGSKLKYREKELFIALINAISFICKSFQGPAFGDTSERKNRVRAGWSWTNWEGLPPLLFFTQAVVDAFAEIDLYIIRPATLTKVSCDPKIVELYDSNEELFNQIQAQVDLSRQWIKSDVLPRISTKLGIYEDKLAPAKPLFEYTEIFKNEGIRSSYKDELIEFAGLSQEGELLNPTVLYNNLYALLILFWTFGDWDDKGTEIDIQAQGQVERTLLLLIHIYKNIPIIQKILISIPFTFYLPGGKYFENINDNQRIPSYFDSGFLTLLSRQLVLFGVYGVGDRNIIDPLIRDNFVDLLLNRHRIKASYSYLWSPNQIEIFSTFRAVQTLTFYYAYLRGHEQSQESTKAGGALNTNYEAFFTGLVEQMRSGSNGTSHQIPDEEPEASQVEQPQTFREYYIDRHDSWPAGATDEQKLFFISTEKAGDRLWQLRLAEENDPSIEGLMNELEEVVLNPVDKEGNLRINEIKVIKEKIDALEAKYLKKSE